MAETTEAPQGFTRRDMLRRGAVVGGTLVWATPAVQTVSRHALAQDGGTPEPDDGEGLSWIAVVFRHPDDDNLYQFKINIDGCELETGRNEAPCCEEPDDWLSPPGGGPDPSEPPVGSILDHSCTDRGATFVLVAGAQLHSWAAMDAGGADLGPNCSPDDVGFCAKDDASMVTQGVGSSWTIER